MKLIKIESEKPDFGLFLFEETSVEELGTKLNKKLLANGYTLKEGTMEKGVYEKGNRVLRILFGAFIKYSKIGIEVTNTSEGHVKLILTKKTSGMSGGLIGVAQVKKEMRGLQELIKKL